MIIALNSFNAGGLPSRQELRDHAGSKEEEEVEWKEERGHEESAFLTASPGNPPVRQVDLFLDSRVVM